MTQHELDCAVAEATGESLSTIECMGFSFEPPNRFEHDAPVLVTICPFCGATTILANSPDDLPADADCSRCGTCFTYDDDDVDSARLDQLMVPTQRSFIPAA